MLLCTTRWRTVLLTTMVIGIAYVHKLNFSITILCMVKTSPSVPIVDQSTNVTGLSHPLLSSQTSTVPTQTDFLKTTQNTDHADCKFELDDQNQDLNGEELDWDKHQVAVLQSVFFVGNGLAHLLAGRIADTFGAKPIVTAALIISSSCSLLTPVLARTSVYLVYAIRIAIGCTVGAILPSTVSMIYAWGPPEERPMMISVGFIGVFIGAAFSSTTSGFLCEFGLDNGWPFVFYIHGGLNVIILCMWWFAAFNSPTGHPKISLKELNYIRASQKNISKPPSGKTPWTNIITSKPMFASAIAHFSFEWVFTIININIPMYIKKVIQVDTEKNGLISSLLFLFYLFAVLLSTKLVTMIISRKILGLLSTRRLVTAISFLGVLVCSIGVGHMPCHLHSLPVVLLVLYCVFNALAFPGFLSNHAEFAGRYSGTTFGLGNGVGMVGGILAPLVVGWLTPNGTQEEWQRVFYITGGICFVGFLGFTTCSSSTLQPWADTSQIYTVEVVANTNDTVSPVVENTREHCC